MGNPGSVLSVKPKACLCRQAGVTQDPFRRRNVAPTPICADIVYFFLITFFFTCFFTAGFFFAAAFIFASSNNAWF